MTSRCTTRTCPHCGRRLAERTVEVAGNAMFAGFEECGCPDAVRERREAEARTERDERERTARESMSKLAEAGIPRRYVDAAHPYAERMADLVMEGQGFYVHGPNGTLKTTLAMAAARILVERGVDVLAIPTYRLMDAMRSRRDEDRQLFDRAVSCGVLVLDDLGKEATNTPYACERLFAIVDERYREVRPVIVTSNHRLSEMARKVAEGDVGKAIASRLSTCTKVPMKGEDRRISNG